MSEIKVNSVVNATGDNDTGIDLATNDQILLKVANATKLTMNSTGQTTIVGEGGTTTTSLQQGLAKSWITFTSASSFTNHDSLNVATLTDSGAGYGTVTMTNVMSSIYHTVHSTSNDNNAHAGSGSHTTANYQLFSKDSNHSLADTTSQYGTVFGDLA